MKNITKVIEGIPEEQIKNILLLAQIRKTTPADIINTATITYFAKTVKPNLKDYETTYLNNGKKISGHTIKLKQKGKNPWKDGTHGMPNHLAILFESIDENEVNKAILECAYRLVDSTLEEIISSTNKREVKKYLAAMEKENFLYVMLQIAVRLVGQDLQDRGVALENNTLDYMLKIIKSDKLRIRELFRNSAASGDIESAITEYYRTLEKYLDNFESRSILITGNQIKEIGKEMSLLDDVGEETIFIFLGYLLTFIKEKYISQKQIFEQEMITIK